MVNVWNLGPGEEQIGSRESLFYSEPSLKLVNFRVSVCDSLNRYGPYRLMRLNAWPRERHY